MTAAYGAGPRDLGSGGGVCCFDAYIVGPGAGHGVVAGGVGLGVGAGVGLGVGIGVGKQS